MVEERLSKERASPRRWSVHPDQVLSGLLRLVPGLVWKGSWVGPRQEGVKGLWVSLCRKQTDSGSSFG